MSARRNTGMALIRNMRSMPSMQAPSLVDLCVRVVIDNLRYLGDVGETDLHLLDRILPHCTCDQLKHIEDSTVGRDLTPVTDKLWKQFYKKDFGERNFHLVTDRMKQKKVAFRWKQLYEAKLKDVNEAEIVAINRIKQSYQKADAQKQRRQIQICSKVPPSSQKRSWGNGSGYSLSGTKSNLMKKAKLDLLKSQEFKNLTAIKKNAVQRNYSASPAKISGFSRNDSASTSEHTKPLGRRS